jgi:hypothetical protein
MALGEVVDARRDDGAAPPYPEDGTYDEQMAWVRERGYPEDGSHEAKLKWVRDSEQLPPYPRHGTPLEKNAWARLSTAYLTDTADTRWHGEDESEPLLEYTIDRGSGEVVSLRLVARQQPRAQRRPNVGTGQRRRTVGTASRNGRDPPLDEPPPGRRDLDALRGFHAASWRMYAHMRRRAATEAVAA